MAIYLTCAHPDHILASITHPGIIVPFAAILPCVPANRAYLNTQPHGGYYCWGCKPHRAPTFNRLNIGDEILLSENGTDRIDYHGFITHKLPQPDNNLANGIWASNHENIFLIGNLRRNMGIDKNAFMLHLTGNNDTLQSPRDYSTIKDPHLWNQYNAIKRGYGI